MRYAIRTLREQVQQFDRNLAALKVLTRQLRRGDDDLTLLSGQLDALQQELTQQAHDLQVMMLFYKFD